jgi:hypothetical protein
MSAPPPKCIITDPDAVRAPHSPVARGILRQAAPQSPHPARPLPPLPPLSTPHSFPQPPPFSSDYPYRPPRVDDVWFQAALPEQVAQPQPPQPPPRRAGAGAAPAAASSAAAASSSSAATAGARGSAALRAAAQLPPLSQREAKRSKKLERGRTPAQRLRDLLARVTAPSALAATPETCLWRPEEAFAHSSPEDVAAFLAFYRTVVAGHAESDVHFAATACRAAFSLALLTASKEVRLFAVRRACGAPARARAVGGEAGEPQVPPPFPLSSAPPLTRPPFRPPPPSPPPPYHLPFRAARRPHRRLCRLCCRLHRLCPGAAAHGHLPLCL